MRASSGAKIAVGSSFISAGYRLIGALMVWCMLCGVCRACMFVRFVSKVDGRRCFGDLVVVSYKPGAAVGWAHFGAFIDVACWRGGTEWSGWMDGYTSTIEQAPFSVH